MTHICVSKLTTIGSDNGLSPDRRQAIIWTNAGILLIGPLGTNFSENLIWIQTFSFKKMPLKMSSAKWRPFCLGLNELMKLQMWHMRGTENKILSKLFCEDVIFIVFRNEMNSWVQLLPKPLQVTVPGHKLNSTTHGIYREASYHRRYTSQDTPGIRCMRVMERGVSCIH